jgi:hypothetical protein
MFRLREWDELPPGILVKTNRTAEGFGVLVDTHTWKEIPFDKDIAIYYDDAIIEKETFKLYTIPKQEPDSIETELE